jgi:hypothetical protein
MAQGGCPLTSGSTVFFSTIRRLEPMRSLGNKAFRLRVFARTSQISTRIARHEGSLFRRTHVTRSGLHWLKTRSSFPDLPRSADSSTRPDSRAWQLVQPTRWVCADLSSYVAGLVVEARKPEVSMTLWHCPVETVLPNSGPVTVMVRVPICGEISSHLAEGRYSRPCT